MIKGPTPVLPRLDDASTEEKIAAMGRRHILMEDFRQQNELITGQMRHVMPAKMENIFRNTIK